MTELFKPTPMQKDRLDQFVRGVLYATKADRGQDPHSDPTLLKMIKGGNAGVYRELRAEGLGEAANVILFKARR